MTCIIWFKYICILHPDSAMMNDDRAHVHGNLHVGHSHVYLYSL